MSINYLHEQGNRIFPDDRTLDYKISLRRVRLNSGGYTSGGGYYGSGAPLYEAVLDDGIRVYNYTFRASNRDFARGILRKAFSNCRFYR